MKFVSNDTIFKRVALERTNFLTVEAILLSLDVVSIPVAVLDSSIVDRFPMSGQTVMPLTRLYYSPNLCATTKKVQNVHFGVMPFRADVFTYGLIVC